MFFCIYRSANILNEFGKNDCKQKNPNYFGFFISYRADYFDLAFVYRLFNPTSTSLVILFESSPINTSLEFKT